MTQELDVQPTTTSAGRIAKTKRDQGASHEAKSDVDILRSTAGGWAGSVDCDQLLHNIYESRAEVTSSEPNL